METLFIPNENDFKRWIKEAVKDFLQEFTKKELRDEQNEEGLLNRKEIAKFLRISLPTLTDWIKKEGCLLINKEVAFILIKQR
jgi:hypothetical protein